MSGRPYRRRVDQLGRRPGRERRGGGLVALAWCVALTGLLLAPAGLRADHPSPALVGATDHYARSAEGWGGAVASDAPLATEAGLRVLRQGGNAADAAVATALALAVVAPEAGNLGGGGFAVLRIHGEVAFLDFRETAPAAAHRDLYLDADGQVIPDASLIGPLAAGVPGSPAGLFEIHRRFGRLGWHDVVEPARRLALDGFPVDDRLVDGLDEEQEMLSRFPETARAWLDQGKPLASGSRIRLPTLARTLERYADEGPAGVMTGPVAEAVVEVSRRHGGILTLEDLASYQAQWREPLRFEAFGWQLAGADLPSSGGILTAASLALAERLDLASTQAGTVERAHGLAEIWRRAYADRFLLGDPSTTRATAEDLLAATALDGRAATFDPQQATDSDAVRAWDADNVPTEPADTTHVSVVDHEGGLVSLTTTVNGLFGCGLWVPAAGFFLNNQMDDFASAPGQPNLYNLIQGEANSIAPGKRMLSSQSPTLAWREGEALVVGGRGGSRIPTGVLQVLLGVWLDDLSLEDAVDRPRIHHQWLPDRIEIEEGALTAEVHEALEALGHQITTRDWVAQVHIARWRQGGRVEAAADLRRAAGGAGCAMGLGPSAR